MSVYLTIITTALVLTQIIRLVQNAIHLKRMREYYEKKGKENENA